MSSGKNKHKTHSVKINVGTLFVIMMAAYFVFMLFNYRGSVKVNYYEVEDGNLVKEHNYTGLILREETIVPAEAGGYLYYYVADGRKAAKGSRIYSIDESGRLIDYMRSHADQFNTLNQVRTLELKSEINTISQELENLHFENIYDDKDTLDAHVREYSSMDMFSSISDDLKAEGINFSEFTSTTTGIVCYYTDGYEGFTETDLSKEAFDQSTYEKKIISAGTEVGLGEPAYKLITSEDWEIAFQMEPDDVEELKEKTSLRIRFADQDNLTTVADFHIIRGRDGNNYGIINLDKYLIQFTGLRFVNFEIVSSDVSGLKIPDKSITTKDFYVIPVRYMNQDENGNTGFYKAIVSEAGTTAQFCIIDIYNVDDDYCYIDGADDSDIKPGDFVVPSATDTENRYQIGLTQPLQGVYNINKGYAVFKRIEPIESSDGYTIIRRNTSYGLTVYDHIVLDAQTVQEGEILYR